MVDFNFNWILNTSLIVLSFYLYSKMFFFKTLLIKTKKENDVLKEQNINSETSLEIFNSEMKKNEYHLEFLEQKLTENFIALKDSEQKNEKLKKDLIGSNEQIKSLKNKLDIFF